jgi:hypothetical protein
LPLPSPPFLSCINLEKAQCALLFSKSL